MPTSLPTSTTSKRIFEFSTAKQSFPQGEHSFPHTFQHLWKTCGFPFGFSQFSPIFTRFCSRRVVFLMWNTKMRQKWKTCQRECFSVSFSTFSTGVFHSQGLSQKHKMQKNCKSPSQAAKCVCVTHFGAFFATPFPHQTKSRKREKTATYPTFRAFPQFPQALLLLLYIHLYHSFVI